jgi:glycosyltransferase involved in cell wall biosynthesis
MSELKLTSEKKPTIAFLTYDWAFGTSPLQPNGCAWYRCYLPMKELEKLGWTTGMGFPGYSDEHGFGLLIPDQKAIHGWEIIVLKLMMLDKFVEQIPKAQAMGQKIVIDIDDHHAGLEPSNMAYLSTDPKTNPKNNRDHYFKTMDLADALITSTPFLHDYYKKEYPNKPIFMVRNAVDPKYFHFRKDKSAKWPTVGWVGATPWRSNDLETLNPFVGEFLQEKNWRFHHSGHIINAPTVEEQLGVPHKLYSSEPMKPILNYEEMFRRIDIGIVPLNKVEFNRAKSFIKGLEYTAAGVPWISTDFEEYTYLNKEFGIGRVASNKDEWLNHFEELSDQKIRNKERQKNMELVREFHTMEKRGPDWDRTYREILAL